MTAKVAIIMGSRSDLEAMNEARNVLEEFGIEYEMRALSAHRTPAAVEEFISGLADRGFAAVIAGAGGAAHLAGVCASHTHLPVFGVPMRTSLAGGLDSLLSTVQMPRGIPVATTATGGTGAYNAALLAVSVIALSDPAINQAYQEFRANQTQKVLDQSVITD
ncbi:5-(carboxyamino)imidazole ribonucleotide mutase [Arcanobacterium pluranimalium]|uniref:5-(carboxyamino)imidazole ribonucleotide mutase n=1 Tax=Arcanobacterium pluranimalium TaxID=108028 RepID=UPI00195A5E79|nr:5-(carboxyamino)imidazole ribonucleotide mutase [Arcanobacterium pluranimalium]MBM7824966.1 5-(carboxyamino)imidazole ribonucleotide mutase [Arcanobacterium pluranimalium]